MTKCPVSLLLLLFSALVSPLDAQVDRAILNGTVRDPSDAVIPAATIKLVHLSTGVEQSTTTTPEGTYVVVNLTPGQYLVQASAAGFQTLAQTIELATGQRARLDVALSAGTLSRR